LGINDSPVEVTRHGDHLVVKGDLGRRSEEDFQDACRHLLDCRQDRLVVDLSDSVGISSANMSFLVNLHFQAAERGKTLRLLVGPDVANVFDRTRLTDLVGMDVEKVDQGAEE
jgi:anti-anti-sigma regulatory factor